MSWLAFQITRVVLYTVWLVSPGLAEKVSAIDMSTTASMLEVLREEVLDTITLDRAVHFTTPQATDVVALAGTYRIEVGESSRMRLLALKNKTTTVVDALSINHQTDIGEPIALYVRDDEKFPHVLLLLPGGKGLEAVGSYDAVRSRSLSSRELTPSQILRALNEKLQRINGQ